MRGVSDRLESYHMPVELDVSFPYSKSNSVQEYSSGIMIEKYVWNEKKSYRYTSTIKPNKV